MNEKLSLPTVFPFSASHSFKINLSHLYSLLQVNSSWCAVVTKGLKKISIKKWNPINFTKVWTEIILTVFHWTKYNSNQYNLNKIKATLRKQDYDKLKK